jgi:hypothetical protein
MSIASAANLLRDKQAAEAPNSRAGMIRRIEQAASAAHPDDMAARFAYRNALRAQAGLEPEERQRGGLAGASDKGFLLPAAAMLLGPAALTLAGGGAAAGGAGASTAGAGTAAGAGAGAAGTMAPAAASGLGGLVAKGKDFLTSDTAKDLLGLGSGIYGISQQNKANDLTADAIAADRARWSAGAPLRDAGMAGLLNPVPAVNTSSLGALASRGNPFAATMPAPAPTLGGAGPMAPVPASGGLTPTATATGPINAPGAMTPVPAAAPAMPAKAKPKGAIAKIKAGGFR